MQVSVLPPYCRFVYNTMVPLIAVCIYDLRLALRDNPGPKGGDGVNEGKVAAIVVGPMLGTNILSTSLIAWKAWCVGSSCLFPSAFLTTFPREYRRTVSAHLSKGSPSVRAEKVLALLIESGLVYCVLWVTSSFPDPSWERTS